MNAPLTIAESVTPFVAIPPISTSLGRAWHVVYTEVNCETLAKGGVEALGFPVYMPCETRLIWRGRRKAPVRRPLFARYVFASFDLDRDPWGAIRTTRGVDGLLCMDPDVPSRVPALAIERLRRAEAAGEFDHSKPGAAFEIGEEVTVEEGPFTGMIGEIRRADRKDRALILLKHVNMAAPVEIPLAWLRANQIGGR